MNKTYLIGLVVLGLVTMVGCSSGKRSVGVRGPYHQAEVGYDVQRDRDGTDIDLVGDVDRR